MKKTFSIFIVVFFLFFLLFPQKVFAQLKINEIYPAPSTGEYEWVELYNDSVQEIDLTQFVLHDLANNRIFINEKKILPFSFALATSSSVLNNSNQTGKDFADVVFLKNLNNEIIDIATYSGSFTPEKTFARCPDGGEWFVLNYPSKNQSNYSACLTLTPSPLPTPTIIFTPSLSVTFSPSVFLTITPSVTSFIISPTPTPSSENTFSYSEEILRKIYLSEAMVYPQENENEWVEIYNDNEFLIFLKNWFIDDVENGGSSLRSFSLEIPAKGYGVIEFSSSIFNNKGDSVRLLDNQKKVRDSFEYESAVKGKTFGRIFLDNDEFCLQEPSKGQPNNPCFLVNSPGPSLISKPISSNTLKSSSSSDSSLVQNFKDNYAFSKNQASQKNIFLKSQQKEFKIFPSSFLFSPRKNLTQGSVLSAETKNENISNFSSNLALVSLFSSFLNLILLVRRIGESIPF